MRHRRLGILLTLFLCLGPVTQVMAEEPHSRQARELIERAQALAKKQAALAKVAEQTDNPETLFKITLEKAELEAFPELLSFLNLQSSSRIPKETTITYLFNEPGSVNDARKFGAELAESLAIEKMLWLDNYDALILKLLHRKIGSFANDLFEARRILINPSFPSDQRAFAFDFTSNPALPEALTESGISISEDLKEFVVQGFKIRLEKKRLEELSVIFGHAHEPGGKTQILKIHLREDDVLLQESSAFSTVELGKQLMSLAEHSKVEGDVVTFWFDCGEPKNETALENLRQTISVSLVERESEEGVWLTEYQAKIRKAVATGSIGALKVLLSAVGALQVENLKNLSLAAGEGKFTKEIHYRVEEDLSERLEVSDLFGIKRTFYQKFEKKYGENHAVPKILKWATLGSAAIGVAGALAFDLWHGNPNGAGAQVFVTSVSGLGGGFMGALATMAASDLGFFNRTKKQSAAIQSIQKKLQALAENHFIPRTPEETKLLENYRAYLKDFGDSRIYTPRDQLDLHITFLKSLTEQIKSVKSKFGIAGFVVDESTLSVLGRKMLAQLAPDAAKVPFDGKHHFYALREQDETRFEDVSSKLETSLAAIIKSGQKDVIAEVLKSGIEVKTERVQDPAKVERVRTNIETRVEIPQARYTRERTSIDPQLAARLREPPQSSTVVPAKRCTVYEK